jgi:hypothetical protein
MCLQNGSADPTFAKWRMLISGIVFLGTVALHFVVVAAWKGLLHKPLPEILLMPVPELIIMSLLAIPLATNSLQLLMARPEGAASTAYGAAGLVLLACFLLFTAWVVARVAARKEQLGLKYNSQGPYDLSRSDDEAGSAAASRPASRVERRPDQMQQLAQLVTASGSWEELPPDAKAEILQREGECTDVSMASLALLGICDHDCLLLTYHVGVLGITYHWVYLVTCLYWILPLLLVGLCMLASCSCDSSEQLDSLHLVIRYWAIAGMCVDQCCL